MRKFLFLLTAVSNFVFAQQKSPEGLWHLTIVNNTTAKGIAGATISINGKRYFITDVEGKYDVDKNIVDQRDSIRISCKSGQWIVYDQGIDFAISAIISR